MRCGHAGILDKHSDECIAARAWQSSEIYNGFNGFYDYGPVGVEMKNNIKRIWWRDMVHRR